ncbi:ABC transporter permease [Nocardia ignorata]|uniref:ABC-2 type transport system permease protein n=1 Tax=Nocardia ignorata TaxID=145285 RepID=A0A4R6PP66_NOCIG|nr:ABC transporter permease [Nocardia ignorata]TDP39693.1 ABC-2 type transport system permease protein [Nocardia ignorata]
MNGVWRIVSAREIVVKLRDRNFVISTVVTIVAIIASVAVSGFLGSRPERIDIVATGSGAGEVLSLANELAARSGTDISFRGYQARDRAEVEQNVRNEKAEAGLAPTPGGWELIGNSAENDDATTYITAAAQQLALQHNAADFGATMDDLTRGAQVSYTLLDKSAIDPGLAKIVALVFAFLFYLASILFGMSIAQSVVEEKQNRIVEILASAIPLRQLLIGKVVGNAVLAFGQLVLFVAAGLGGLVFLGKADQLGRIAGAAGWFIVFFVVGFLALASLWAVAGSLSTRSEDLQSTSTPLSMLIMIVLFAGIFLSGTARVIASYVPITSIIAMPSRLAEGTAAWWEPLIALTLMAAATYAIVILAEKIYRRSLMQTQGRLTLRQALALED